MYGTLTDTCIFWRHLFQGLHVLHVEFRSQVFSSLLRTLVKGKTQHPNVKTWIRLLCVYMAACYLVWFSCTVLNTRENDRGAEFYSLKDLNLKASHSGWHYVNTLNLTAKLITFSSHIYTYNLKKPNNLKLKLNFSLAKYHIISFYIPHTQILVIWLGKTFHKSQIIF